MTSYAIPYVTTRTSQGERTVDVYSRLLSDRVVYTKHALRNALIPITTIVAFDIAGIIGGAVITSSTRRESIAAPSAARQ